MKVAHYPFSLFFILVVMPLLYPQWRRKLLASAGTVSLEVEALGEFVLEYLWRDGCEPSITALLHYVQDGLHPTYEARRQDREHARALAAPAA
jgi:hypothetical protein